MRITRDSGQEAVVNSYLHWHFLLVEYCTGFGKAKAALNAVSKRLPHNNPSKGMILVHSEPARDVTWPIEIKKWAPHLTDGTQLDIVCYHSAHKYKDKDYDWVIADECHYITESNAVFFKNNKIRSLILMTGTLPDSPLKLHILKKLSNARKLTITLDEAISNEVLNDYRVVVWNMKLTPYEWTEYLRLCGRVDDATSMNNPFLIRIARGERMHYIYNLESKYKAACYIRDQIRAAGRRLIIFACSKTIAYRICEYRLYEGTGMADFNRFKAGEINELVSIKMIQEGANIDDLQSALMQQLNSKSLNFMQKLGRLMRLEVGQIARVHIICAEDTYDAHWVKTALSQADPKKITYKTLDRKLFDHYN